jgi:hypothetical protein
MISRRRGVAGDRKEGWYHSRIIDFGIACKKSRNGLRLWCSGRGIASLAGNLGEDWSDEPQSRSTGGNGSDGKHGDD